MKLYYSPGACSLAPHIVLAESGLPYSIERVDLQTKKTEVGTEFTAVNRKGCVPALLLDKGEVLTEVPAIVQYIADRVPDKNLIPAANTWERYRVVEWLNYVATELHKTYVPLFRPDTPVEYRLIAQEVLRRNFGYVAEALEDKSFLIGNDYSVADVYMFVVLGWAPHVKLDLSHFASLQAYANRIGKRAAVLRVLRAEGLVK